MTKALLLHPLTQLAIDNFIVNPGHALIIEGKIGSGKYSVAQYITCQLLTIDSLDLGQNPNVLWIGGQEKAVIIENIRQIQQFLKLKTVGSDAIRRVVVVESAESMTTEAQNAFLKILEEPPADTVILVLTTQKNKLLPTIRSRTQLINLKSIDKNQLNNYFQTKGHQQDDINKAYYAAGAQIGLMSSLLDPSSQDTRLQELETAKAVIAMTTYQRLIFVDEFIKQKKELPCFISALLTICDAALKQTVEKGNMAHAVRWLQSLKVVLASEAKLSSNPNTKLLLTDLMLNL